MIYNNSDRPHLHWPSTFNVFFKLITKQAVVSGLNSLLMLLILLGGYLTYCFLWKKSEVGEFPHFWLVSILGSLY